MKRTQPWVYDRKYHLVWAPKYRKWISRGDLRERTKEIFEEISIQHDFEIDTLEIAEEHVHVFPSFPPRYSISKVVGIIKGISANVIFRGQCGVETELWGGEF